MIRELKHTFKDFAGRKGESYWIVNGVTDLAFFFWFFKILFGVSFCCNCFCYQADNSLLLLVILPSAAPL